jgi:glycine reductase complex component B subunit gamma
VLEKEIERSGIPAVLITTLIPTAKMLGANRVVAGNAITSPLGDPKISLPEEKALRRRILTSALEFLTKNIAKNKNKEAST